MSAIYPISTKLYVPGEVRPYAVRAADDRFVIATKPHFKTVQYFILDFQTQWRGPDNMVLCAGYESDEDCQARISELSAGQIEISRRRGVPLFGYIDHAIRSVTLPDGSAGQTPAEIIAAQAAAKGEHANG